MFQYLDSKTVLPKIWIKYEIRVDYKFLVFSQEDKVSHVMNADINDNRFNP